jgi:predicted nucleic acid-binding protein
MAQRLEVLLDSSVPIKAQRQRLTETAMLVQIRGIIGPQDLRTSNVVLTELLVGAYCGTADVQRRRQEFVNELRRDIRVHPYSIEMAELAGRIGGEQAAIGQTIPPIDLMIGVTALSLTSASSPPTSATSA